MVVPTVTRRSGVNLSIPPMDNHIMQDLITHCLSARIAFPVPPMITETLIRSLFDGTVNDAFKIIKLDSKAIVVDCILATA